MIERSEYRKARKYFGLSQNDIAKDLGVGQHTISRFERDILDNDLIEYYYISIYDTYLSRIKSLKNRCSEVIKKYDK
nr:MAG TPA: putative zinc finger/helix-turn-helix protein, YgiT family [Caudoviricetes sp.]